MPDLSRYVARIIIFDDKDDILVIKRSETAPERPLQWELPGGWVDDGEEFQAGAIREAKEETGIEIKPEELQLVHTFTLMGDKGNMVWFNYICRPKVTKVTLSYEHVEYKWVPFKTSVQTVEHPLQKNTLEYLIKNNLVPPQ